jgi:hypothetical protein
MSFDRVNRGCCSGSRLKNTRIARSINPEIFAEN